MKTRTAGQINAERWREKVYARLGGALCRKCGFSDRRALQFDHRNGGGHRHRRAMARVRFYRYILAHPNKFQVLCANCNWIKRATRRREHSGSAFVSPTKREQMRASMRASWRVTREKRRRALRRAWADPIVRKRRIAVIAATRREVAKRPEVRSAVAAARRRRWAKPGSRKRQAAAIRAARKRGAYA